MQTVSQLGVLLGGLGLLMISFGVLWWVSLYAKEKGLEEKEKK